MVALRALWILFTLVIVPTPLAAQAPQPEKPLRIGLLGNNYWPPMEGLRQGLRDLGYVEVKNLHIEPRWAQDWDTQYPKLACELAGLGVDAIVTWGTPATLAAKSAAPLIPVVMAAVGDPVAVGAVANLEQPGGKVTGLSSVTGQMEERRLELLKELQPQLASVAVLAGSGNPAVRLGLKRLTRAGQALGIKIEIFEVSPSMTSTMPST